MKTRLLLTAVLLVLAAFSSSARSTHAGGPFGVIALGGTHSCAVTPAGGAKCWGENDRGQLGDGSTSDSATPVDVAGLSSGVAGISAGAASTCAITTAGAAKCWGANEHGQLGDGSTADRHQPVDVSGLTSGVSAITAGTAHSCALMRSGGVKCWGANDFGQLGSGNYAESHAPVDVAGLTDVTAVAASSYFTCALTAAGGVKCWGDNGFGQLGDGTDQNRNAPVDVVDLSSGVSHIGVGGGDSLGHACAAMAAGGLKCWGNNEYGQLGDDRLMCHSPMICSAPVDVLDITGHISQVSGGLLFTCAVTDLGLLECWGNNQYGQLGYSLPCGILCGRPGGVDYRATPASAVVTGLHHACAAVGSGHYVCWGDNFFGQLGDNGACGTACTTPVGVFGLSPETPGDVNCDQSINSIDAALVLQYGAGLVTTLACLNAADANHDGRTNSIDAALILQFSAGLIHSL